MKTTTILIYLLITLLAVTDSSGERAADMAEPTARITGSMEEVALAESAISSFFDAGLSLPPLEIVFHEHRDGCRGHVGVFRMIDGRGDVQICRATRYILLHELAHAWEAANMDDQTRDEVMEYWGVDNWNDHGQSAGDRGAEKVADAIAFALDDPSDDPNPVMRRNLCSYRLVTGQHAPALDGLHCE